MHIYIITWESFNKFFKSDTIYIVLLLVLYCVHRWTNERSSMDVDETIRCRFPFQYFDRYPPLEALFEGNLGWRLYHRSMKWHRYHIYVHLLPGSLVRYLAIVHRIVRGWREQVIRRGWCFGHHRPVDHLVPLRIGDR